ncbi:radical SAM protein [Candidatus Woesearchaeota archaeon]|nr:radical SAM protein [Candidatus Woesearchaeota archaeon]
MAKLEFEDIRFEKQGGRVRLVFLKMFETSIESSALEKIGKFMLLDHTIDFPDISDKTANNKFMPLLDTAMRSLKSILTGNPSVYIHQNSNIPLIGSLYFGIVDRGTNIIEAKPITGCNIDCPFCSVDAGKSSGRPTDFVVEDDYLIQEVKKLIGYKQGGKDGEVKVDIFVNTHGEPLLYANMPSLINGLRKIPGVRDISIITNGTLLTVKLADELISAGLNKLNVSLNAIDPDKARELAGTDAYNVNKVIDICCYVADKLELIIAPVWIKGNNDDQIPKIINFAKGIGARVGIQNYMLHKKGRKLAKQAEWDDFYAQLDAWEKQTGMDLKADYHTAYKTRTLEKPFRKGDTIKAEIVCPGRLKNELLAVSGGRVVSVINSKKSSGQVKVRIIRDKDNIFVGEAL